MCFDIAHPHSFPFNSAPISPPLLSPKLTCLLALLISPTFFSLPPHRVHLVLPGYVDLNWIRGSKLEDPRKAEN